MARYIDADKLIKKVFPVGLVDDGKYTLNAKSVKYAIDTIPTADVVEVVRCKDCRLFVENKKAYVTYCKRRNDVTYVKPNDFCSYGERKE